MGLLAVGLVGGIYLGQGREVQQRSAEAQTVVQVNVDDMQLLKQRQSQHAAARAWQRQAEGDAADKAAAEARVAASRAHELEAKAIAQKQAAQQEKSTTSSGPVPYKGPIPTSCNEFSGSRAIGCTLMLNAGFTIDQFPCLDKLWKKESGWNYRATNRGSGAYGIPQALPGSKMAKFGDSWKTSPEVQIKWGLDYIEGRYSSPCGAWSHSQNSGWY